MFLGFDRGRGRGGRGGGGGGGGGACFKCGEEVSRNIVYFVTDEKFFM